MTSSVVACLGTDTIRKLPFLSARFPSKTLIVMAEYQREGGGVGENMLMFMTGIAASILYEIARVQI